MSDRCSNCGARLQEYEEYNAETGNETGSTKACPNHWREAEKFDDCPEVV